MCQHDHLWPFPMLPTRLQVYLLLSSPPALLCSLRTALLVCLPHRMLYMGSLLGAGTRCYSPPLLLAVPHTKIYASVAAQGVCSPLTSPSLQHLNSPRLRLSAPFSHREPARCDGARDALGRAFAIYVHQHASSPHR
ncbi:uncharacterized protein C8Q71DRAFT_732002 [Rhodofomes roseus]|uniref:Secreted protein n=1 Tax=Rhodofomes roseus TaxID=34475 RepID=A0ABQ8L0U1_9APHY|nr:uncharacterized protein C8Q71DRAFT_732002 [Rhodofomes roseus]KAH9844280.1 hypothetical protein C8Q71DRAFT_732002 [Rhodofomes roseus]